MLLCGFAHRCIIKQPASYPAVSVLPVQGASSLHDKHATDGHKRDAMQDNVIRRTLIGSTGTGRLGSNCSTEATRSRHNSIMCLLGCLRLSLSSWKTSKAQSAGMTLHCHNDASTTPGD